MLVVLSFLAWAPVSIVAIAAPTFQTPAPLPVLRDLVIEGVTVFGRTEIFRWLQLKIGDPLPRAATELARELQSRYTREGFSFARVTTEFDEPSGRLTIKADEGRIDEVEFTGVDREVALRFSKEFTIQPGDFYNTREAGRAVRRLLAPARGAYRMASDAEAAEQEAIAPAGSRAPGASGQEGVDLIERNGRRVLIVHLQKRAGRFEITGGADDREDWFSPVDGLAPSIGFRSTTYDHARFNHTFVSGHVNYKFAPDRAGYAIGFERPLFAGPKLYFGAEVHDLTGSDDLWRVSTLEQSLVALGFRNTFRDYYNRRGYQAHLAFQPHPSHEVLALWRDERHAPLVNETEYGFFRDDHRYRPNAEAADGQLRSVVLGYTWDSRGLADDSLPATYRRHQVESLFGSGLRQEPGWRIEWTSELASPGLGGAFDFRRHILNARRYTRLSPHQRVDARLLAGFSDGGLPVQRQFAIGGIGSVHGYAFKEAAGERMVLVNVEYKLDLFRSGMRGVAFLDAGRVFRPVAGSREDWLRGVGLGLDFSNDLRIDFGWRLDDIPKSLQILIRLRPTF